MKLAKKIAVILSGLTLFAASTASAHDDKYLDSIKTPHDGQVRMAGLYHFELLLAKDSKEAKENPVTVYVTDHAWAAQATKGATATLTIVQGKNKVTAELKPEGENRFVGKAVYASTANLKGALSVTMAGKATEQARFTPFVLVKKIDAEKEATHEHKH